jgi:membrane-associated HD superfamily phosphohydrolase
LDWLYRSSDLKLKANTKLKVYAAPDMTSAEFHQKCREAIDDSIKAEIDKAAKTYDTKIAAMQRKIESQELDVKSAENSVNQRRLETLATGGAAVFGMLTGRKRSISSTISKTRMASEAKDRLTAEQQTLKQYQDQLAELQKAREDIAKEINDKFAEMVDDITEINIRPNKSDIFTDFFAVVWLPFFVVDQGGKKVELPAFKR